MDPALTGKFFYSHILRLILRKSAVVLSLDNKLSFGSFHSTISYSRQNKPKALNFCHNGYHDSKENMTIIYYFIAVI